MASLTLDRVWLHLASDPGTYETFWSTKPQYTRERAGEVRSYANGRLRTVARDLARQTIDIRLLAATAAQVETLEDWTAQTLMHRDDTGRVSFGTYFDLGVHPYPFRQGYEVALTFQQVSYVEEI